MRTLTDEELSAILREWPAVMAPPSLRTRVLGRRSYWRMWAAAAVVVIGIAGLIVLERATRDSDVHPHLAIERKRADPLPEMKAPVVAPREFPRLTAKMPAIEAKPPEKKETIEPSPAQERKGLSGLPLTPPRVDAKPIEKVDPLYPAAARAAGVSGMVTLNVRIGKDGRVIEPIVMSGNPLLVPAAVEAVKKWVYRPILLNGQPREVVTQVELEVKP